MVLNILSCRNRRKHNRNGFRAAEMTAAAVKAWRNQSLYFNPVVGQKPQSQLAILKPHRKIQRANGIMPPSTDDV